MTSADEPPALAYIEKALADSYRKEIDQEENVWRTLPFFAAVLALQLAALFQVIDKLPAPPAALGWVSVACLIGAAASTLASLAFLAGSIRPQSFDYVAREPALLAYTWELVHAEHASQDQPQEDPFSALVTLKTEIARQYAQAADHNRQINKRRERLRSIAGLAALGSVLTTVFLVAVTYAHYLSDRVDKDREHAAHSVVITAPLLAKSAGDSGEQAGDSPHASASAPDAGGHQGVVGSAR